MNAGSLLLIATLALPTSVLVLRSGERIAIQSSHQEDGRIIFRTTEGRLFSLPAADVDLDTSRASSASATPEPGESAAAGSTQKKLKATAEERRRLIEAIEQNHSGVPSPPHVFEVPPPPPSLEEVARQTEDEWTWRNRAKALEESAQRARENRDLLIDRIEALRSHILGLISLGFKPAQFTYDTSQLVYATEQIPQANLEIARAERALAAFREEARRRGITPGWLR